MHGRLAYATGRPRPRDTRPSIPLRLYKAPTPQLSCAYIAALTEAQTVATPPSRLSLLRVRFRPNRMDGHEPDYHSDSAKENIKPIITTPECAVSSNESGDEYTEESHKAAMVSAHKSAKTISPEDSVDEDSINSDTVTHSKAELAVNFSKRKKTVSREDSDDEESTNADTSTHSKLKPAVKFPMRSHGTPSLWERDLRT